jgi:hypothetical protein
MTLREILNSAGIEYTVEQGVIKSDDTALLCEWPTLADTGPAEFFLVGHGPLGECIYESPDSELVVATWAGSYVSLVIDRPNGFQPLPKRYCIGFYQKGRFEEEAFGNDSDLITFDTVDEAVATIRDLAKRSSYPQNFDFFDAAVQDTTSGRIVWSGEEFAQPPFDFE